MTVLLILTLGGRATKLPTAVYRISEGAAEYVDVVPINDYNAVADTLEGLKKRGCKILATSSSVVSSMHLYVVRYSGGNVN